MRLINRKTELKLSFQTDKITLNDIICLFDSLDYFLFHFIANYVKRKKKKGKNEEGFVVFTTQLKSLRRKKN